MKVENSAWLTRSVRIVSIAAFHRLLQKTSSSEVALVSSLFLFSLFISSRFLRARKDKDKIDARHSRRDYVWRRLLTPLYLRLSLLRERRKFYIVAFRKSPLLVIFGLVAEHVPSLKRDCAKKINEAASINSAQSSWTFSSQLQSVSIEPTSSPASIISITISIEEKMKKFAFLIRTLRIAVYKS